MTEIIIDESRTGFLIKKFKELFNPIVVSEDIETVLSFDNQLGKGTFRIITLEKDILNIYFEGTLNEELKFKFFNADKPVLNCFYLNKGELIVDHTRRITELAEGRMQQLIYNSEVKDNEILTWPSNVKLEFNFLKLFNLELLNSEHLKDQFIEGFYNGALLTPALKFETEKLEEINSNNKLIDTTLVGKARMRDLENQVYSILKLQLKELFKQMNT